MFERFTDSARRIIPQAQVEARALNHPLVGTEHFLAALAEVRPIPPATNLTAANHVFESLGVTRDKVIAEIIAIRGKGDKPPEGHLPITPRAKKVLDLAYRQSLRLGHSWIGTEHLLLGIIEEGEGVAAQILVSSAFDIADLNVVRKKIFKIMMDGMS
jgi:ATP-dependent Clp protease ATP-binding subunit ClpC